MIDHLRKHLETHNRPRIVGKKLSQRANNSSIAQAFAKANKNSKDPLNSTVLVNTTTQLPPISPSDLAAKQIKALPSMTAHLNEGNSLSSAAASTPSPLMLHVDDVAVDDEDLLEDELDEFESNPLDEEFLTMNDYEQQIHDMNQEPQTQYVIGNNKQVYQLIEQELPMY